MDDCEIVFDLRCLQDPSYKDRGVGKLSANLVRAVGHLRERVGVSTLGLVDPALPPPHVHASETPRCFYAG